MPRITEADMQASRQRTLAVQRLNRPQGARLWNEYEFHCPACLTRYEPATTKIAKIDGRWHCEKCRHVTRSTSGNTSRAQATPDQQLNTRLCATCHQPLSQNRRRIIVNVHGHLVHYRCPRKK